MIDRRAVAISGLAILIALAASLVAPVANVRRLEQHQVEQGGRSRR